MCPAHPCTGNKQAQPTPSLVTYTMLQQQKGHGYAQLPPPKDKTKCQVRRYPTKLSRNQDGLHWQLHLQACPWTHGQVPPMGKSDTDPKNELYMQYNCKSGAHNCNNQRISSTANAIPTQGRRLLVVWGDKKTGNISHAI
jgi:hypothetical protein